MKLSEAIRLGSMMKPQARGGGVRLVLVRSWRGWLLRERVRGTCALQAAADAIGHGKWTDVYNVWPNVAFASVRHPVTGVYELLASTAWDLNDSRGWTREQIADWVEQIEAQHEPEPEVGQQNLTEALR